MISWCTVLEILRATDDRMDERTDGQTEGKSDIWRWIHHLKNEESSKKILRKRKLKKINTLKYKPTRWCNTRYTEKTALVRYNKTKTKWIIDQKRVKRTLSTNQTNKYHPTTKDNKQQKEEKIANKIQIKYKTK